MVTEFVDKQTKDKRKNICNVCDKKKLGFCTECGCVVITKVMWERNKCPLNKW